MSKSQAKAVMGAKVTKVMEVKRPLNVMGKKVDFKTGIDKLQGYHTGVVVTTNKGKMMLKSTEKCYFQSVFNCGF